MTLKEYIKEISEKIIKQWLQQQQLKSRFNSRLDELDEKVAKGENGLDDIIKELEDKQEWLAKMNSILKKSQKLVYSCAERAVEPVKSERIRGNKGNIISEESYRMGNDLTHVQRNTIINGNKYSLLQTTFGDYLHTTGAYIEEGFENGEKTYYEFIVSGGGSEKVRKELAYDDVTETTSSGIVVQTKKRNPEKDVTYKETIDYENGTVITTERPILDANGHVKGNYSISEKSNTQFAADFEAEKTTIIESKCIGKEGNQLSLKSVITHKKGAYYDIREDYLNGELVTKMYLNRKFLSVEQFEHGNIKSWAKYEYGENTGRSKDGMAWEICEQFFYDKIGNRYNSDEVAEMPEKVRENPEIIERKKETNKTKNDSILFEQKAFFAGAYIPIDIRRAIVDDIFEKTRSNPISAYKELHNIEELRIKQQQREQQRSNDKKQQQDWD